MLRIVDRGLDEIEDAYKVMAGFFVFGVLLMIGAVFMFVGLVNGSIFVGVILFFFYVAIQVILYLRNDGFMQVIWKRINRALVIIGVLAAAV